MSSEQAGAPFGVWPMPGPFASMSRPETSHPRPLKLRSMREAESDDVGAPWRASACHAGLKGFTSFTSLTSLTGIGIAIVR